LSSVRVLKFFGLFQNKKYVSFKIKNAVESWERRAFEGQRKSKILKYAPSPLEIFSY